jgi:hypothetical protein
VEFCTLLSISGSQRILNKLENLSLLLILEYERSFADETYRSYFEIYKIVFGKDGTWHNLDTCLWGSPFPLTGYQDLQVIYPDLENFFTKKMKIKKVTSKMLISEVKRMAEQKEPQIEDIRLRLLETGMMLAKNSLEPDVERALNTLKEVKFLPKRLADGESILVGMKDDFAILDHARYGKALANYGVLLDFDVDETQILDVMFQYLGLTSRYLSLAVVEQSSVGDEVHQNQALSHELQMRAYALYW